MAAQLLKRVEQLATERGISREYAMQYLLEQVVKGRQGEAPPESAANRPPPSLKEKLTALFSATYGRTPEIIARAPGRIEFIGNHTDYNGGTVLGAAIDRGVWVAVASRSDRRRRFLTDQRPGIVLQVSPGPQEKFPGGDRWVNYPLGVLAALPAFGLNGPEGFDYAAVSDLPPGAGLSSSAAIELASGLAFLEVTHQQPAREILVKAARYAENNYVGVPCGILDQGVSGFGRKDHLVYIDCRGPVFSTVAIPADAHFWIFNTHTKHALVDGLYAARHQECMEAARLLGVSVLADVPVTALADAERKLPPVVFRRTKHIVEEIARVEAAVQALRAGDLSAVGALLTASHRSSQQLFENSTPELDFLVDTLVKVPHVHGARLTGGGFGGAVMALTGGAFDPAAAQTVVTAYENKFGARPDVLHCRTANGAEVIG